MLVARGVRRPRAPRVERQPLPPALRGHAQGVRGPARAAVARAVPRVERQADRAAPAARVRLHARGVHAVPVGDGGRDEPLRSVRAAHVAAGSPRRASSRRCSTTGRACRRRRAARGRASRQSSFDAWIKLYKPDESNLNTTVSYYLKGGLVMFALDLQIRRRTEGARIARRRAAPAVADATARRASRTPRSCSRCSRRRPGSALGDVFDAPDPRHRRSGSARGARATSGSSCAPAPIRRSATDGAQRSWLGVTTSGQQGHRRVRRLARAGRRHLAGRRADRDRRVSRDRRADLRSLARRPQGRRAGHAARCSAATACSSCRSCSAPRRRRATRSRRSPTRAARRPATRRGSASRTPARRSWRRSRRRRAGYDAC